jgi:uncharacterized protein YebE (UPF0316 family)
MAIPASVCGFLESLLWLIVVSQVLRHLTMPLYYVAYAAGFAAGNYVGLTIERRLAMGHVMLQVVTQRDADLMVSALRSAGLVPLP